MTIPHLPPQSKASGAPTSKQPLFSSPRERSVICALVLVLGCLALYQPSLHNSFINFDDPGYVTANPHVLNGLTFKNIGWAFTATEQMNWHPLSWISHMADVQFFGLNPTGHHLTSVALHCINVVLIFLLLRAATGYLWRSAVLAALFAVFPLNVEAVAWVAERKTVLSTTFLLLALFAYGWYARKPGIGRYVCLAGVFALGLMAKPMLVTLPILLLVADYWPLERIGVPANVVAAGEVHFGRRLGQLVIEKIPLFLLSLGSGIITLYAARRGGALSSTVQRPIGLRLENASWSYFEYVLKTIWPSHLSILYPFPDALLPAWKVALATSLVLAISAVVWRYRAQRYLLAGWLWFLITLAPVSGIAQVGAAGMADRFMYTACWGLFAMAIWSLAGWMAQAPSRQTATAFATVAVLFCYAWVSHVQIGYWKDSYSVFSHALKVTGRNGIAEVNLGVALMDMGRTDLAKPHLERAVRILPEFSTAHFNLGTVLQSQGKLDQAKQEYMLTLKYTGDPEEAARAHNNLATVMRDSNQPAAAIAEFSAALRLNPDELTSLLGRATLEYRQGDLQGAEKDLRRVSQVAPSAIGFTLLGQVLEERGELSSAVDAYQAALDMSPGQSRLKAHIDAVRQKMQQ